MLYADLYLLAFTVHNAESLSRQRTGVLSLLTQSEDSLLRS